MARHLHAGPCRPLRARPPRAGCRARARLEHELPPLGRRAPRRAGAAASRPPPGALLRGRRRKARSCALPRGSRARRSAIRGRSLRRRPAGARRGRPDARHRRLRRDGSRPPREASFGTAVSSRRHPIRRNPRPRGSGAASPLYGNGLAEFRAGRFFEAHEEWELLWKDSKGDDKVFLQGLIQLAAACVHIGRGNAAPAKRLLELAKAKLDRFGDDEGGINLGFLRKEIEAALAAAELLRIDQRDRFDLTARAALFTF